jgi:hypothetical protein
MKRRIHLEPIIKEAILKIIFMLNTLNLTDKRREDQFKETKITIDKDNLDNKMEGK